MEKPALKNGSGGTSLQARARAVGLPPGSLLSAHRIALRYHRRDPIKTIVRGFTWTTIPITWRNRRSGTPQLKIKEMGGRYLFICLEKYFSAGDYKRPEAPPPEPK